MLGVTGTIFQAQRPVTTFRADRGEADRTHQMLTLEDHVRVTAIKDGSRLNCDRLVYDARGKFYRATGHVTILGPAGQVGTLSEVLTTPDLAVVATPELFPLPPLTRSAGAIQP
jgi:lipopolysaccharide assembly outer membrane protein LptD (OstA)